jgi:peptide/nickel transport system substrate-binding protein
MNRLTVSRIAAATAALVAGWSCNPAPTCTGDWCGTAVVVSGAEADVLIPPASQSDVGIAINDLLFFKLADVGPELSTVGDTTFVPLLAESWRFVDPLTLEFMIHSDARWHDGTPVTAADIVFTFDVYRDTLIGSIAAPRLDRISSVTATDERTAVFRFSQQYPEQFFDAVYHMRIIPEHLLGSTPRDQLASHPFGREPIGTGPFRFERWRAGESIELVADSTFFLGRPGLRRIVWRFASDQPTALTQLLADEADVLNFLGGADNVTRVEEANHLRVVEYPSSVYSYVTFNFHDPEDLSSPHPLFSDREVRRALTMAVDRAAIVQAIFGSHGKVPPGPISPVLWVWDDELQQLPFDSAAARRILAARGWTDSDDDGVLDRDGRPFEFELLVPTSSAARRNASEIIQDQLRRIGVSVQVTGMEFNAFLAQGLTREWDAWFGSYGGEISPASIGEVWSSAAFEAFNYGRYSNPAFDQRTRDAMNAMDLGTAESLWHEALEMIVNDAPAIWVYAPLMVGGVHARLEDVTMRADQWAADLWKWRVPAAKQNDRDRFSN